MTPGGTAMKTERLSKLAVWPGHGIPSRYRSLALIVGGTGGVCGGAFASRYVCAACGVELTAVFAGVGFFLGYCCGLAMFRVLISGILERRGGALRTGPWSDDSSQTAQGALSQVGGDIIFRGIAGVFALFLLVATVQNIWYAVRVGPSPSILAAIALTASGTVITAVVAIFLRLGDRRLLRLLVASAHAGCLSLATLSFVEAPSTFAAIAGACCLGFIVFPLTTMPRRDT